MPFRTLNSEELALRLNLMPAVVDRLVKSGEIPFERRGGRVVLRITDSAQI